MAHGMIEPDDTLAAYIGRFVLARISDEDRTVLQMACSGLRTDFKPDVRIPHIEFSLSLTVHKQGKALTADEFLSGQNG